MKEGDLSLLLKYFLAWYEFHLEQRHIQETTFDPVVGGNHITPVNSGKQHDTIVSRMHQELGPAARHHRAGQALMAEMFQRWRNVTLERRRSSPSRLTDPDIITNFVRQLQQRVLGDGGVEASVEQPGITHHPQSVSQSPRVSSPGDAPGQSPRVPQQQPAVRGCPDGDSIPDQQLPSPGPAAASDADNRPPPPPPGRPLSAGGDSGGSIDLCAEIMTSHALRMARRRPVPDTESAADPRRAPHLHSFLMNARSNRRQRLPAAPSSGPPAAAAPAPARPPYQEELERRAERWRLRQQECRRRRQQREAADREAERQRHEEFQRQLALESRQQQEQLRQRRLQQEQLRRRQLRGQQQLQERQQLADDLRSRQLVRRVFRAMVRHVQRSRQLESAAELWARSILLRRCLSRWRHHRALLAAEREEAAAHWHRSRLATWALTRWRQYVHHQRLKAQAAADLCQLQRLQAALRAWQASLALSRVRQRQKMQRAASCDVRLTCAGALRRWRRLPEALERERAIEARKERLRRIVREMVPDFQPPAAPAIVGQSA